MKDKGKVMTFLLIEFYCIIMKKLENNHFTLLLEEVNYELKTCWELTYNDSPGLMTIETDTSAKALWETS